MKGLGNNASNCAPKRELVTSPGISKDRARLLHKDLLSLLKKAFGTIISALCNHFSVRPKLLGPDF